MRHPRNHHFSNPHRLFQRPVKSAHINYDMARVISSCAACRRIKIWRASYAAEMQLVAERLIVIDHQRLFFKKVRYWHTKIKCLHFTYHLSKVLSAMKNVIRSTLVMLHAANSFELTTFSHYEQMPFLIFRNIGKPIASC